MTKRLLFLAFLVFVSCAGVACNDNKIENPAAPDPSKPTPTPVVPPTHTFEFRVTGTLPNVEVRVTTQTDGTTVVTTDLPWFYAVKSAKDPMFVSAQATGTGLGRVQVQIFVDGALFREAVDSGFDPSAVVGGSWSSTTAAARRR